MFTSVSWLPSRNLRQFFIVSASPYLYVTPDNHSQLLQTGQPREQPDSRFRKLVGVKISVATVVIRRSHFQRRKKKTKTRTASEDWSALQTTQCPLPSAGCCPSSCCNTCHQRPPSKRLQSVTHSFCRLLSPSNSPAPTSVSWLPSRSLSDRLLCVRTCFYFPRKQANTLTGAADWSTPRRAPHPLPTAGCCSDPCFKLLL
jgi:hypothetical protein